ncbi:Protein rolling stone [Fasciolopsis buskii]|uniref:Protein rolling stone n=1 Tax=Fasciolopsis buskii TaxID=27845 RepID=A0A8E0VL23_9TREM|nr:Protein rolling stone [Fasciolopsis buski]
MESPESRWHRMCGRRLHDFFVHEFSWRGLGFSHTRPSDFTDSQWLWMKPWLFVVYRVLLAIGFIIWVSFDIPREIHHYYDDRTYIWFLYATNWAFGMLTLTFFLLAVYALVYNCPQRADERIILYQPLWFLYTISVNGMIVVSLVFWIALSSSNLGVFSSQLGRLKHSLAAALVVLDLCLCAIPIRLIHVLYPVLVGIVYSLFSYVFWLSGIQGPLNVGQVYPGLNWSLPRTAILTCLCVILFSFLMQIFLYLIYYARVKLSSKLNGRGYAPPAVVKTKSDYGELGGNEAGDGDNQDDLLSVNSMSTCVETKMGRDYGAVE